MHRRASGDNVVCVRFAALWYILVVLERLFWPGRSYSLLVLVLFHGLLLRRAISNFLGSVIPPPSPFPACVVCFVVSLRCPARAKWVPGEELAPARSAAASRLACGLKWAGTTSQTEFSPSGPSQALWAGYSGMLLARRG